MSSSRPRPSSATDRARQLSLNRARRRAQVDQEMLNHKANLRSMYRRIKSLCSETERKKNPYDVTLMDHPGGGAHSHRASHGLRFEPSEDVYSDGERPMARGGVAGSSREAEGFRASEVGRGAHLDQGGRGGHRHADSAHGRPHTSDGIVSSDVMVKQSADPYIDFRDSMMDMVVERQLYTEEQLEELFQYYLNLNPPCHHKVLHKVIKDIRHEFNMD